MEISQLSYAKLNLHLNITGKRNDGYHSLVSLFNRIDLADELHFTISDSGESSNAGRDFSCDIIGSFDFPARHNLMYKAAEQFCTCSGKGISMSIAVRKHIPEGSGMGGGSSNAAAVLKTLATCFPNAVAQEKLVEIGASLGADIPFFLSDANTALVAGKGELIEPIELESRKQIGKDQYGKTVVVVYPGFHVSTAEAFRMFDLEASGSKDLNLGLQGPGGSTADGKNAKMATGIELGRKMALDPSIWPFSNDFEDILVRKYPVYNRIFSVLRDEGAAFVSITGSGAACYGIFSYPKPIDAGLQERLQEVLMEDLPALQIFITRLL